ncbi:hypothetical protein CEE45_01770 [Candidatus Heimdallarchaeota archaeon B3_Heim]|nr:MAG: hypothetical protein CEE45_01770 [Candidatus Heimdallarchaeota archaeon B3_Heim]
MSTEGTVIRNLMKKMNLIFHSQIILIYIIGFKRLFYHRGEDESQRKISVLKLLIFLLYLCAFVFAFLQFAEGNIPATVREEWSNKENVDLMEMFPLSRYGEVAFIIVVILVLSIFYFFITQDKPIKHVFNSIKDYTSQSKERRRAILIIFSLTILYLIYQVVKFLVFPETFETLIIAISYKAGIGFLIIWVVLQPLLVFTGLLLTFDMIAKDFPRPFKGYNKYNIPIFILTILLVIGIAGIISSTFGINFDDDIGEGLPYAALSVFPDIFYSSSGVSFMLIGVVTISTIIISLIFLEIYLKHKRGVNELQERRMANFMFLFPFLIIYVLLKAFPFAFSFSLGLQSLNDILDLIGLFIVIFFSVFRVIAIKDTSSQVELSRGILQNPKKWLDLIPSYCKVLIIFYLAFVAFYAGLEANTVFALSGATSQFEEIQMLSSIGISFFMLLYVFWRYKPEGQAISTNE